MVAQEELKIVTAQHRKLAKLDLEQKRLEIGETQLDSAKKERENVEETLRMAFRILGEGALGLSQEQRLVRAIDLVRCE